MQEQQLLKQFGFTEYEIKIYTTLLQRGAATAKEIADSSGVPSNKVYAALLELIEKGFVATLNLRPKQYKITSMQPFKDILMSRKKEIKKTERTLASFQQMLQQKHHDLEDVALVLKGKKKIVQMLAEASENTKEFGYSFVGDLYFDYLSARSVANAIQKGVDFRFLVHKNTEHIREVKQWKKIGVKIKYYPKKEQKSIRFSTFDAKVCRITIGKPEIVNEEDYLSFWIESPAFASLLRDQFLNMWKKSKDA